MKNTLDKLLSPGAILAAIFGLIGFFEDGIGVAGLVVGAGLVVVALSPRLSAWAYYLSVALFLGWVVVNYDTLIRGGW